MPDNSIPAGFQLAPTAANLEAVYGFRFLTKPEIAALPCGEQDAYYDALRAHREAAEADNPFEWVRDTNAGRMIQVRKDGRGDVDMRPA